MLRKLSVSTKKLKRLPSLMKGSFIWILKQESAAIIIALMAVAVSAASAYLQYIAISEFKDQHRQQQQAAIRPYLDFESGGLYMTVPSLDREWKFAAADKEQLISGSEDMPIFGRPKIRNYGAGNALRIAVSWELRGENGTLAGRIRKRQLAPGETAELLSVPESFFNSDAPSVVGELTLSYVDVNQNEHQKKCSFIMERHFPATKRHREIRESEMLSVARQGVVDALLESAVPGSLLDASFSLFSLKFFEN